MCEQASPVSCFVSLCLSLVFFERACLRCVLYTLFHLFISFHCVSMKEVVATNFSSLHRHIIAHCRIGWWLLLYSWFMEEFDHRTLKLWFVVPTRPSGLKSEGLVFRWLTDDVSLIDDWISEVNSAMSCDEHKTQTVLIWIPQSWLSRNCDQDMGWSEYLTFEK